MTYIIIIAILLYNFRRFRSFRCLELPKKIAVEKQEAPQKSDFEKRNGND